jgi:penicillin-binding protein 1A
LARAATLAGIAPAPSDWNPLRSPKQARVRELYVLNRMIANRMITPQQASAAYGFALPRIVAQSEPDAPTVAPEFRDMVGERLKNIYKSGFDSEMFASGGVKVRTTLDLDLQKAAVEALHEVLPKRSDPEAAIAAIDPRSGDIRAIAEKKDGGYTAGGLNLANGIRRSSGSTIKPFTLAVALQQGHTLGEVAYAPECIRVAAGYKPCNAEKGSSYQTLGSALVNSINTVYAPLAVKVGLNKVISLAQSAGMAIGPLDLCAPHSPCDSYALGVPTSPLSEADAYATLVDHGLHHDANTVLDVKSGDDGEIFDNTATLPGNRVLPKKVADEVTSVMRNVVDHGTGTEARQPFPVYGKTGTTDNYTNAWFTGCTPTLCISVWMGYDKEYLTTKKPHSMTNIEGTSGGVFGGTLPARIFAKMYSDYRALQAPKPTATPTPTATRFQPQPRLTSQAPSSPSPTPTPAVSVSPSEAPSPTPSQSLLPTPP